MDHAYSGTNRLRGRRAHQSPNMMMVMTMLTKRQLGVLLYAPLVSLDTDCVHEQASFVLQTRGKLACTLYIYVRYIIAYTLLY